MIDVENETLIPLREVPAWCKQRLGNRVHRSTVHRWRLRGVRGIHLETMLAGGTRYTSAEALSRFFAGSTAAADGVTLTPSTTTPAPSRASSSAKSILDAEEYFVVEGI